MLERPWRGRFIAILLFLHCTLHKEKKAVVTTLHSTGLGNGIGMQFGSTEGEKGRSYPMHIPYIQTQTYTITQKQIKMILPASRVSQLL